VTRTEQKDAKATGTQQAHKMPRCTGNVEIREREGERRRAFSSFCHDF
jgi:hypothetical protein